MLKIRKQQEENKSLAGAQGWELRREAPAGYTLICGLTSAALIELLRPWLGWLENREE